MKTTKKGFTLIELIVVIAIIGVLAAILVPSMLGYVKKSKVSSANSTASSVYKAINSALTELDEEGVDIGITKIVVWNGTAWTVSSTAANNAVTTTNFSPKVANFFSDITSVKRVDAQIVSGSCVAVAAANDSTYTGTYPGKVVTTDNYESYKLNAQSGCTTALTAAIAKAGYTGSGASCTKATS
ncbi:MAG: type II secretion system protein [Ruminococcus sp.]|nr:type II secretion system protein [Ruminococcus sp.]